MANALVAMLRGVASLANDQLDDCLARLQEADRLARFDCNWVGRKVVRGVCTLMIGCVQCMMMNPVKGVWNVLRSWQWIRCLQTEALQYDACGTEVLCQSCHAPQRPAWATCIMHMHMYMYHVTACAVCVRACAWAVQVVRSSALFALGAFNIIISLLPPKLMRAASYLSGFQGDRQARPPWGTRTRHAVARGV